MKTYKIDQCCLYKIVTLNKLCEILHINDVQELQELADAADNNYLRTCSVWIDFPEHRNL